MLMIIKSLKVLLIGILSVVVLFVLLVVRFFSIKIFDTQLQLRHMNQLVKYYESESFTPIDEQTFIDFDMFDPNIKLNDIQMLASHNSYKKKAVPLGRLFVGLGDSFAEARALNYEYLSLTKQLELGIRSMEFDLRLRKDQFMLTHVPLVDNSSVAPLFDQALQEIKLYSDHNPNHLPIIILLEIKDDWMILDHALQKIDSNHLIKLNNLLRLRLDDHLFEPHMMMESGISLKETVQTTGWPSLSELLGKIIFVLHPGSFTNMYYELDPTLETLPMFIGAYKDQITEDYASFVVHNTPDVSSISNLVSQNFMVRTRIDSSLIFNESDFEQAKLSGAQILTSDFTVGRKDLSVSDMIYLPNQKMIIRKPI